MYLFFPIKEHGSIECTDEAGKIKHSNDNPFIEPVHGQTVVDMKGLILHSNSTHYSTHHSNFALIFSLFSQM